MHGDSPGALGQPSGARRVAAPPLTLHWPEYLIEATCLGLFMISACMFGTLFFHPASPLIRALPDPTLLAHPDGSRDGADGDHPDLLAYRDAVGAHMNPSTTLTFFRLGKVVAVDTLG